MHVFEKISKPATHRDCVQLNCCDFPNRPQIKKLCVLCVLAATQWARVGEGGRGGFPLWALAAASAAGIKSFQVNLAG